MISPGQGASTYKFLTLAAAGLLAVALMVVLLTGAAQRYEVSIYKAYPPHLWVLLLSAYGLGLLTMVRHAFSDVESRWWLAGLAVVWLSTSVLLLLPFFRGYVALGDHDPLHQLGLIKDIQFTGHFGAAQQPGENFYPALHILVSSLSYSAGLEAEQVVQFIPALFFGFYIVSVYLLSRELVKGRGPALLMTAFAALPLYTSTTNESFAFTIPRMETLMLLPFVLYLFLKARRTASMVAGFPLVLLLLLLPTFHPGDGGLYLVGLFLALGLASRLYEGLGRWWVKDDIVARSEVWVGVTNPLLIAGTMWFMWFSAFRMFEIQIERWADWVIYGVFQSEAQYTADVLRRGEVPLLDVVILIIKRHGHQMVLFLVATMIALGVGRTLLLSRRKTDENLFVFSVLFGGTALATVFFFLAGTSAGYTRFIGYAVFAAALLNGYGLYMVFQRWRNKALASSIVTLFLLMLAGQGIANVYPSPFVAQANPQVTVADRQGMKWFLAHQDDELLVEQAVFTQDAQAAYTVGEKAVPENLRWWDKVDKTTPDHFGYPQNDTFGASYEGDRYFISHALSRVIYTETIPEYKAGWRWTPEDFARLESDPTVSRLYDSVGFEVWYVEGQKTGMEVRQ